MPRGSYALLAPFADTPLTSPATGPLVVERSAATKGDGSFCISVPGVGAWALWAVAAGHVAAVAPLWHESGDEHGEFRFVLAPDRGPRAGDAVWVVGNWSDFRTREKLTETSPGVWSFDKDLKAPSAMYSFVRHGDDGKLVEFVPLHDGRVELDGRRLRVVRTVPGDGLKIRIEATKLNDETLNGAPPLVVRDRVGDRLANLAFRQRAAVALLMQSLAARTSVVSPASAFSAVAEEYVQTALSGREPARVRAFAAVLALMTSPSKGQLVRLRTLAPASSLGWGFAPLANAAGGLSGRVGSPDETYEFVSKLSRANPDPRVRAFAHIALAERARAADQDDGIHLRALSGEYGEVFAVREYLLKRSSEKRDRKLAVGAKLGGLPVVRRATSPAADPRPTLYVFAARGCGPCDAYHQQLATRLSGSALGVSTVTLLVGASPDEARDYAKLKPLLTWSVTGLAEDDPILDAADVWRFPSAVLVGPDGRVLALDEALRAPEFAGLTPYALDGG